MKYDVEFKLQAIALSDEIGIKAASQQLGISYHTLADWRHKWNHSETQVFVGSGKKAQPLDEKDRRIQELEAELMETKRANEILKDALGFFASSRKK